MTTQLATKEERDAVILPTPEQFFNDVISLNDKLEIHQRCNHLKDLLAQKHTVSMISKKWTEYRKKFVGYVHGNDNLNEVVNTDKGDVKQHIAVNLLVLSEEQLKELADARVAKKDARDGFNVDGTVNEETLEPINVEKTIDTACKLINSNDATDIIIGLSLVTGRRGFELAVKNAKYDDEIVGRDFQVVSDFTIGFCGVAKKSIDEMSQYQVIQTLIPSELVVKAYNRLINFSDVKKLDGCDNRKFTDSSLRQAIARKFKRLFGKTFATFELKDGELEKKEGALHKARAFYACTIKAILKAKKIKDSAIYALIQKSLAHKKIGETMDYLKRYESSQLINLIDIPLTTNIKELGVITMPVKNTATTATATVNKPVETEVKEVKETTVKATTTTDKKTDKDILTMDLFISQLPANVQLKIGEFMSQGEKIENILTSALIDFCESKQARITVTSVIEKLFDAIKLYNDKQTDINKKVYPTYGFLNKINQKLSGKQLAATTYNKHFETAENEVNKYLTTGNNPIPMIDVKTWNNKHHRKNIDTVIDAVITIYRDL